jgi:ribosomal protein L21E
MTTTKQFNPATRHRCVNVAWRNGRHVRILDPTFGYQGKIGTITYVGAETVSVRIKLGKKSHEWDEVAYLPEHLRLI